MDWNEPTNSDPAHPNVLADLNDKDTYAITLGQTNAGFTGLPEGTINYDHGSKFFRRKESTLLNPIQISLAGGGTGAENAAGARGNLGVLEAGTGTQQARTNQQNQNYFCPLTRQVSTSSPLQGGGQLDNDLNLRIQDGTTAQKGAVQLNNTLTSTSTTQALTAAQGKVLNDKVQGFVGVGYYNEADLPLSGAITSGSVRVVRVGSVVTISGICGHSSAYSASMATDSLPVWARPSYAFSNLYDRTATIIREVRVSSVSNNISFDYHQFSNNQGYFSTNTYPFTISYTVA